MWRRLSCSAFLVALAACGADSDLTGPIGTGPENPAGPESPAAPGNPAVASLAVTPDSKTLLIGESLTLSITAKDKLGLPCDCKPSYSSSDPAIASVSSDGLVSAKAVGEVWITVLCVGGVSAKAKIIVTATLGLPATLVVLPDLKNLKIGESVQLSILAKDIAGLPCDCKPSYSSADVKIAVVSSTGLVTAKAAGEVWITVTCVGGLSAKVKIVVTAVAHTVSLDPVLDAIKVGAKLQLKVIAKDINGLPCDCAPIYSSSDPTIASVSTDGLVSAKAAGEVWITVLCAGGVSAKVKVVVKAVVATVALSPASATLKIGSSLQLAVIAKDLDGLPVDCVCTFESLNPLLAKVTNTGLVTGLLAGLVEVKATCEGISAKTNLTLVL